MNTKGLVKGASRLLRKHGADILFFLGVTGMGLAAVDAVMHTTEATKKIEKKKEELGTDKLTPVETVQATWKCYARPVVTGITSVGCLLGSRSISNKRNAVLAAACALSEANMKEYVDKVADTIGEKKEREIREALAEDRMKSDSVHKKEVIVTKKGNSLCYDHLSGRYFQSNIDDVKNAVIALNSRMISEMYVSLNDFYYELGLDGTDLGMALGWNIDEGLLDVFYSSHLADDGTPCLDIQHKRMPKYGFDSY